MEKPPQVRPGYTCTGFFLALGLILAGVVALLVATYGWLIFAERKGPYHNTSTVADLDSDGDLDALLGTKRRATLWWNDGDGQFSPSGKRFPISERHGLAVEDFNGDGLPDIFAGVYGEGYTAWLNRGNGEFYRP
jgi:hypothetical protein